MKFKLQNLSVSQPELLTVNVYSTLSKTEEILGIHIFNVNCFHFPDTILHSLHYKGYVVPLEFSLCVTNFSRLCGFNYQ